MRHFDLLLISVILLAPSLLAATSNEARASRSASATSQLETAIANSPDDLKDIFKQATADQQAEALSVYGKCANDRDMAIHHDCGCRAANFLKERIEKGVTPSKDVLLIDINAKCPNVAGTTKYEYDLCISSRSRIKLAKNIDKKNYCECIAAEWKKAYEPLGYQLDLASKSVITRESQRHCMQAELYESVAEEKVIPGTTVDKPITTQVCEDINLHGVTVSMEKETVRQVLIKNGFAVRDVGKPARGLIRQLYGEKKPSGASTIDHATGIVKQEGDVRTIKFQYRPSGFISSTINVEPDGIPGWNALIKSYVDKKVASYCGDMGSERFKKHNGIACSVSDLEVKINYTKKDKQITRCIYSLKAGQKYYTESVSAPKER